MKARPARSVWMLFDATVRTYLALKSPRDAFLEDGLINSTIDRLGARDEVRAIEVRLHAHLEDCRAAHLDLLTRLFVLLWGPIARPLGRGELRAHSFDESAEPKLSDYYDEM